MKKAQHIKKVKPNPKSASPLVKGALGTSCTPTN
ncbi:hypothetical protein A11Q_2112 [Pseudobdellovibrio exovorus JSS]|uniref:Uncharacterized protein n=1 Tax=Pseudobdellovibrio exovorus JSS TaxID=1184267 RepID=M4VAS1_9BACT|nr:hypothetical protein A11Q_2112 [Pseudobdellovibrio exovorus JSS]